MHFFIRSLLLLAALKGHHSFAQSDPLAAGHISGYVTEHGIKEPIPFTPVHIVELGRHAITDEHGRYAFQNIPAGRYTIMLEYVGFEPYRNDRVKVRVDEVRNVDIVLRPAKLPRLPKGIIYP